MDIGSSFLPSDLIAAFLYAQLENLKDIQDKRKSIWTKYDEELSSEGKNISRPFIPANASNNAHMYYIICDSLDHRDKVIKHMKSKGILCVFHYLSLHKSVFFADQYQGSELINSDLYSDRLLRLPLFYELSPESQQLVIDSFLEVY